MSVAIQHPYVEQGTSTTRPPRVKRWTKEEYNQAAEQGLFGKQRLFLFRGELIEMAPMGNPHAMGVNKVSKFLHALFDLSAFDIRCQMPFDVPGDSMPEPDFLVCTVEAGRRHPHPTDALWIIEITDSSLKYDHDKVAEYADAGVPDYWLLDVANRQLEVYRLSAAHQTPSIRRYGLPIVLSPQDSIVPLAKPEVTVKIADLLP